MIWMEMPKETPKAAAVTEQPKPKDTFPTREACKAWIDARVVRFSYSMGRVPLPGIKTDTKTYVPDMWTMGVQKGGFIVLDPSAPDYKATGMEEPLSRYAKPVRQGREWIAFVGVKKNY